MTDMRLSGLFRLPGTSRCGLPMGSPPNDSHTVPLAHASPSRPEAWPDLRRCEAEVRILASSLAIPKLRRTAAARQRRRNGGRSLGRVRRLAAVESPIALTVKQAAGREGVRLAEQLEAMACVYQIEQDESFGRRALAVVLRALPAPSIQTNFTAPSTAISLPPSIGQKPSPVPGTGSNRS